MTAASNRDPATYVDPKAGGSPYPPICPICKTEGWCLLHGYPTGISWKESNGDYLLSVNRDGWYIEAAFGSRTGSVEIYAIRKEADSGL